MLITKHVLALESGHANVFRERACGLSLDSSNGSLDSSEWRTRPASKRFQAESRALETQQKSKVRRSLDQHSRRGLAKRNTKSTKIRIKYNKTKSTCQMRHHQTETYLFVPMSERSSP